MTKRTALITDTSMHLGPDLARELARRGHNLVVGEPADGLVAELEELGSEVVAVRGVADLSDPASIGQLVEQGLDRFGSLDAACIRTGSILVGSVFEATVEDVRAQVATNLESVLHTIQTVLPPMLDAGSGQVVIVTSAAGDKPALAGPIYSATRAAANMLIKATALSIADQGVTLNAVGTNFLDYPKFREATGADDPKVRAAIADQVPLKRLGLPSEVAHFVAALLDGNSAFQTGQFFPLSGGWNS